MCVPIAIERFLSKCCECGLVILFLMIVDVFSLVQSGTVGWTRDNKAGRMGSIPGRSYRRLERGSCGLSSLVLQVDGWVRRNSSCVVVPLTSHQCSIHYESSVSQNAKEPEIGAADHSWHSGRNTKPSINKTELIQVCLVLPLKYGAPKAYLCTVASFYSAQSLF